MNCVVSVIVPCYNQSIYLKDSLQSVLNQSFTQWECIIVNDGSTDDTEKIALEWMNKDIRFKYIFKKNGGLSSARNAGIKASNGKYIFVLDADDYLHKDLLKLSIDRIKNEDTIGVVTSWGKKIYPNGNSIDFKPKGGGLENFLLENSAIGNSFFLKEVWQQVGGYDENMKKGYEDWEFYIRICKTKWKIVVIEDFLFNYRQREKSMRVVAVNKFDAENRLYIYNKHSDLINKYGILIINHYLQKSISFKKVILKKMNSIEYQIGLIILKPFRLIKKAFK
ncbi:MAG: glycosyltransferase family 2 protein [Flavobacterium sp.]